MTRTFWHIWTIPLVLGTLSLFGLLAGLIGDGLLDALAWVSLAIPLLIIGWFVGKPKSARRKTKGS